MATNDLNHSAAWLRLRSLTLSCALLSSSSLLWSMDLLQAYEAAQKQDATILAARAAAAAGRERLPQAQAQLRPVISFGVSRNSNNLSSTSPDALGQEQTTDRKYMSGNKTLSVRQPVFRSLQMAQVGQARAQVDDAEATLAQEEQALVARVVGAYFDAVLSHDQLDLILSQRTSYTSQLDAARKSFAAGSGTRTDVDEAQARMDMNVAQELESRQNVAYTLRQLEMLVNQPIDKLSRLDVSRLELLNPQPNSLDDWTARAELSSPKMQSLKAQLDAARQEVMKANAGHHPTLDAVAQLSRSESENMTNISNRYNNASVSLQLNFPIYSGGSVDSAIRQALAGQEHAEQALEAGRRDLGLQVYKEFRGVTESIPRIKALEQALRSADQLVISNHKSFQAGVRTLLDALNAEQQRMVVRRDLAQARHMYLTSRIRLLALVGSADSEAVATINRLLQS